MEPAKLTWSDGVPVAERFDDPYFAKSDGLAETRHTYLAGNDLPRRFCDGFCVAELGFGTGLNAAATLAAWVAQGASGVLRYVSFEAFAMSPCDMERALAAFPELAAEAAALVAFVASGDQIFRQGGFELEVIHGDARETLPAWQGRADAWYLDGFSPAKNPELWEAELMQAVGEKTNLGGTFATYTAAGHVRRKLEAAGFEVARSKGFGSKRHMSTGRLR